MIDEHLIKKNQRRVVILIPCYNEEKSLPTVIKMIPLKRIEKMGLIPDVIVINNNSTDNTEAIAKKLGAHVINEKKKGKGNAIRTGFSSLPKDTGYVVMLDGDATYDPGEITRLIEPLINQFCKVVIGSRLSGKMTEDAMSFVSRIGNFVFTNLVRVTHKVAVTDVLTGYFAWTREAIDDLAPHLRSSGFAIEMEMITKMARLKYQIYSVPISYTPRIGESSLHPFKDGYRIMKMFLGTMRWKPHLPHRSKPSAESTTLGSKKV